MPIKILVVDDSAFMRRIISDILNEDSEIEVIGTCRNGKDALVKIEELNPDIVTLDVEMPVMDGLTTLEKIMLKGKIPVIMLSSLTSEGAESTIKALELGAIDFITKPNSIFDMDSDNKKQELIAKIKGATKAKLSNNIRTRVIKKTPTKKSVPKKRSRFRVSKHDGSLNNLIAIGTSTGGPRALQAIIPYIHKDIDGSILIVQHMPPGFTKSLADRLNTMSHINVKEAEDGEVIKKGWCYVAPGDQHLKVQQRGNQFYINLTSDELVSGHRPSVDVLMNSVAEIVSINTYGVILTGMGGDGAKGMYELKKSNGYTIAQNEESCVIYGMPKVAVKLGAIEEILPLEDIAEHLNEKVGV